MTRMIKSTANQKQLFRQNVEVNKIMDEQQFRKKKLKDLTRSPIPPLPKPEFYVAYNGRDKLDETKATFELEGLSADIKV